MFSEITIKDVKVKIGVICKQHRKLHNLSQQELADALDISRITVQNVENGKNSTLDTLLKVANHFSLLDSIDKALDSHNTDNSINSLY